MKGSNLVDFGTIPSYARKIRKGSRRLALCQGQREFTLPISSVHRSFGEHLGRPKIAHGSHNDVRRLCWPNWGCESPLAEPPKGLALLAEPVCVCVWGGGVWLGGTDWGDYGRKVSTQRKYVCVDAGSDVRGKCKRITLTLSSVLTYQCMYVGLCIMHGRRQRGQGVTAPPPSLESGEVLPTPLLWISPSRRLHFDFKSRHPL